MKKILIVIFLISLKPAFSQEGKIYLKNPNDKGTQLVYMYEPPKGLLIPENAVVRYLFEYSRQVPAPLVKKENRYEFSIPRPDSASFVMFAVADSKNKPIDNNNDKGFVIYLKDKTPEQLQLAKLDQARMSLFANYALGTKLTEDEVIARMENLYKQNPGLKKQQDAYMLYLRLQYTRSPEAFKPVLLKHAQLLEKQGTENDLTNAIELYSLLKMKSRQEEVVKIILTKFPTGNLAKQEFTNAVFSMEMNEQLFLERLSAYQKKFGDTSSGVKERYYSMLIMYFLNKKDMTGIEKYEGLMMDKMSLAGMYNNAAWSLTGENLTAPGADLAFAEQISKKSLDIVKDRMNHPITGDDAADLQSSYIGYADTYALIMYKQKKFEMAYQVQDEIYRMDTSGMGTDGRERLAAFMEKVKGAEYSKAFIERQLMQGQNSAVMVKQLGDIYQQLQLPADEFKKLMNHSAELAHKTVQKQAMEKYGDLKALDFSLTNLEGKKIDLSAYKGKVVVLDFWATWCGPCRASLPHMQDLVKEYKDKDVVFFFVDTWQDGTPAEVKKEVAKFMQDNKYQFEVLFDYKDEVVKKYKIEAIPTKIVINKNGEFLSINSSADNLKALIDQNLN